VSALITKEPAVLRIEDRLRDNLQLALHEGDLYFAGKSSGWTTLRKLSQQLDAAGIAYATVGGFALFHHGYRQYTECVEILLEREGLRALTRAQPGLAPERLNPWHFADVETGVSVRFSVAGDPPSGTAWKSLRYPNPRSVSELDDGIRFVDLPTLVSIMLAAWLGGRRMTYDLANTQELIKARYLTESLAEQLHEDVREAYLTICESINRQCGNYLKLWPLPIDSQPPVSMKELIALDSSNAAPLETMRGDGIEVFAERPYFDHHAVLFTTDRIVAHQYDMHHESEYWFND
jgi:hypothetical protein